MKWFMPTSLLRDRNLVLNKRTCIKLRLKNHYVTNNILIHELFKVI
jgi:hypothetical protein